MSNLIYEKQALRDGFGLAGGVDEAGRGPLAGPVVAAAVILNNNNAEFKNRVDDSKLLSPIQRQNAYYEITKNAFVGVGIISELIIDTYNILEATKLAMVNAVNNCVLKLLSKNHHYQKEKICFLTVSLTMFCAKLFVTNPLS